jgi:hypothetical protein
MIRPVDSAEVVALKSIPARWVKMARCPGCDFHPLSKLSWPGQADQLSCPSCGTAFVVEANGRRLRLVALAADDRPMAPDIIDRWLRLSEIKSLLEVGRARNLVALPTLSDADVMQRATALAQAGNLPETITIALVQAGAAKSQAEEALAQLDRSKAGENGQKRQIDPIKMAIAGVVLLVVVLVTVWFTF